MQYADVVCANDLHAFALHTVARALCIVVIIHSRGRLNGILGVTRAFGDITFKVCLAKTLTSYSSRLCRTSCCGLIVL
jgi:hypothetical protein